MWRHVSSSDASFPLAAKVCVIDAATMRAAGCDILGYVGRETRTDVDADAIKSVNQRGFQKI